jgi:hypothetical protein
LSAKLYAAALKPRRNWRKPFLPGPSLPRHARIATTPDTVRQAHAAAIVEAVMNDNNRTVTHAASRSVPT